MVAYGPFPLSEQDGLLRFRIDGKEEMEATIREGMWESTAPKGATLTIGEILFGDRKAVPVGRATVYVPESGEMRVQCRWQVPTLLRVIGEDGEEIREVECWEHVLVDSGRGWPNGKLVDSPIKLDGMEGFTWLLVRARDHAWSRIAVFVGFGGERVVRLARAGVLDVRLVPSHVKARIEVGAVDGRDWVPDESGRATIDALPAGGHEIRVEVDGGVIAEARANVRVGATTRVVIPLPPEAARVPLRGTTVEALGWTEDDNVLPVRQIDARRQRVLCAWAQQDSQGRWSMRVPPGRYCLMPDGWTWAEAVDVGPEGKTDVRLALPPPCDVEVRLLDRETGELLECEEPGIAWVAIASGVDPEVWGFFHRVEDWDEPGISRFRAPLGTIVVGWDGSRASAMYLEAENMRVELAPGMNRIPLRVGWTFHAEISLRDGAIPVAVDREFGSAIQVSAVEGGGEMVHSYQSSDLGWMLRVTRHGRYRVSFPVAIDGYEPIEPLEIELTQGEIPRIEVALRPRRR